MSAPIRSMTGFARVHRNTEHGDITVSLKTVNHRGLDLHFHLDSELDAFEAPMRAMLKRAVSRGHVDIRCSIVSADNGSAGSLNKELLRAYIAAFRQAAAEQGFDAQPDLNAALRIPGMFGGVVEREANPAVEGALLATLEEATGVLNSFRAREGQELAALIREHNGVIARGATEMEQIRASAAPAFHNRLTERLQELLRGSVVEPQRIAQEAAMIADRSDIGEEIARLQIHSRQVNEILDAGGEVGKRLDFLLQEMNRESNTVLSKTGGIGDLGLRITELALESKAAIEKIREQALNLE